MADFPSSRSSSPEERPNQQQQQQFPLASSHSKALQQQQQTKKVEDPTKPKSFNFPTYDFTLASARRPRSFEGFDLLEKIVSSEENIKSHPLYFYHDELVAVIYDAYPKASVHLLMLPRDTSIKKVTDFNTSKESHRVLLDHMKKVSNAIMDSIFILLFNHQNNGGGVVQIPDLMRRLLAKSSSTSNSPELNRQNLFRCGFHSKPSLHHCHMHIISKDFFSSPNLKTRIHYLSFATDFFFELDDVMKMINIDGTTTTKISQLEISRRITCENEAYSNTGLLDCYYCGRAVGKNFALVKKHVLENQCGAL